MNNMKIKLFENSLFGVFGCGEIMGVIVGLFLIKVSK